MTRYLELGEFLELAEIAVGAPVVVHDVGLLLSALGRPRATVFGEEAYPTLADKAAALMESLARNHALADGNKRSALMALLVFAELNGRPLTLPERTAVPFVLAVAQGELTRDEIAACLVDLGL